MHHSNRSRRVDVVSVIMIVLFSLAVSLGMSHPVDEPRSDWIATGLLALTFVVAAGCTFLDHGTRDDES